MFDNNQMQLIVKDIQVPESITTVWFVGMDPLTTDCNDLAEILPNRKSFKNLPIHTKIQQLKIKKTDASFEWNQTQCVKVVTILCTCNVRKVIVKALRKTFNSVKPKDRENKPNGTTQRWWNSLAIDQAQNRQKRFGHSHDS